MIVKKIYQIGFWNLEPKILSSAKEHFGQALKVLGNFVIQDITGGTEDPKLLDQDLLIVDATHLPFDFFDTWMHGLVKKMEQGERIWVPALIYGTFRFNSVKHFMDLATQNNWYFDFIQKNEFETLPLRVANLLKIHDHLKEMSQYEKTLQELETKVKDIEAKLGEP